MPYRSLCLYICAILVAGHIAWGQAGEKSDAASDGSLVCAKVDGTEITEDMVMKEINTIAREFSGRINPVLLAQKDTLFYTKALDRIINNTLLVETAKKEKVDPDTSVIDKNIESLKSRFPSEAEFLSTLQKQGLSEQALRDRMKEDLMLQAVIDKHVEDLDAPSDAEMKTYYDEHPEMFTRPEQVRASHILLRVQPNATDLQKDAVKAKLQRIVNDIKADKTTFADAAKEYSEDPGSGKNGGDLNYFSKGKMVPEFDKAAFSTEVGNMSDIIETQFGYHVIQVTDHKDKEIVTLDTVKDKLSDYLKQEEKSKRVQEYLDSLREKANVEEIVSSEQWKEKQTAKMQQKKKSVPKAKIQIDPNELK